MQLVILRLIGIVARNGIVGLKWRYYSPKMIFWTIGEYLYLGLLSSFIIFKGRGV